MVELLGRLDIDYVFLLPGSSYRGLHDLLVNLRAQPQAEDGARDARADRRVDGARLCQGHRPIGVCILHDLVGLMNGSMGVYNAFGDHAPVLVLGGSGPLDPADRRWIDWLHCASTQSRHRQELREVDRGADHARNGILDAIAKATRWR